MSAFVYDKPVVGVGRFTGREHLLRSLTDGVRQGRSFAVIGGPKIGKSSTMGQVIARLRERFIRYPQETKLVPIVLDAKAIAAMAPLAAAKHLWQAVVSNLMD